MFLSLTVPPYSYTSLSSKRLNLPTSLTSLPLCSHVQVWLLNNYSLDKHSLNSLYSLCLDKPCLSKPLIKELLLFSSETQPSYHQSLNACSLVGYFLPWTSPLLPTETPTLHCCSKPLLMDSKAMCYMRRLGREDH